MWLRRSNKTLGELLVLHLPLVEGSEIVGNLTLNSEQRNPAPSIIGKHFYITFLHFTLPKHYKNVCISLLVILCHVPVL